jgi:hypothetical protein
MLAEEHCEPECKSENEGEGLGVLLAERVPEVHADAVPRKPSAAAPLVALGLAEPLPLCDTERVEVIEGEPEEAKLVLEE